MWVFAALVKLLRRCLGQLTMKARAYVDTCTRYEREAELQVFPFVVNANAKLLSDASWIQAVPMRGNMQLHCFISKCGA